MQDDDGFILFETRAICRYIAAKYPESRLIPTDPKKNALFEQAASIELMNFEFNAGPAVFETWGKACVPVSFLFSDHIDQIRGVGAGV